MLIKRNTYETSVKYLTPVNGGWYQINYKQIIRTRIWLLYIIPIYTHDKEK